MEISTSFEPFRIKTVEPLPMLTREERVARLVAADYNPFQIRAEHVLIDLLTDSGTGAMSAAQWSAMMRGDESYAGARSFHRFHDAVQGIFGHRHVFPTHQGRAAEHVLFQAVVRPGDLVPGNTHFDTTRANLEAAGAEARDLPIVQAHQPASDHPFKGNLDVGALEACIAREGRERIPFVLVTVTSNSVGGQPVSLSNLRAVREVCLRHGIPLLLDAARFAENAYLIKLREPGWGHRTPADIAREMFSLSDGALMSMKKDAFGNIGGVLTLDDDDWAERARNRLVLTEGFPTYGGLAGRDLEALAVGLEEVLEEPYLAHRIASVASFGEGLAQAGVPVLRPFGGHAVYVDGRAFCSHLADAELPAWSLTAALYQELGVRACEVGNVVFGRQEPDRSWRWPELDLVRLALPRRVYTRSHLDYVVEGMASLLSRREEIAGLSLVYRPPYLPHFTARLAPAARAEEGLELPISELTVT